MGLLGGMPRARWTSKEWTLSSEANSMPLLRTLGQPRISVSARQTGGSGPASVRLNLYRRGTDNIIVATLPIAFVGGTAYQEFLLSGYAVNVQIITEFEDATVDVVVSASALSGM